MSLQHPTYWAILGKGVTVTPNVSKGLILIINYLYVQFVIRQCFCFPNSQWGVTTHDIPPQREDRKLDIWKILVFCLRSRNMPWKGDVNILFTQSVHAVNRINPSRV